MPLGEIIGEGLFFVVRVVAQVVFEFVLEMPVRGVGYVLCRLFRRPRAFDSDAVLWAGLAFWIPVLIAGFWMLVVIKQNAAD